MKNRPGFVLVIVLLIQILVTACGDSTPTNVPTSTISTVATNPPATAGTVATTISATTLPVTTPVSTTPVATTGPVTTAAPATTATISSTTQAVAANQFPLTVVDGTGTSITFNKIPGRIICLSEACLDALAELELAPPVATADFMYGVAVNPRIFGSKATNIGKVSYKGADPNIEELAAFKPDLVISDSSSGSLRDALKTISPLYLMGEIKNLQTAGNELKKLAGLLGRNQQAEATIKRLNDKLAAYKAKSPRDLSILIMANYSQGLQQFIGTDETSYCSILNEVVKSCGIKAPSLFAGFAQVSMENILQADPQALFVISVMAAPAGAYSQTTIDQQVQYKKELENNALWKGVSAIKNGRLHEVDRSGWYSTSGTRSLGFVLDDVMTKLYPDVFPKPLP